TLSQTLSQTLSKTLSVCVERVRPREAYGVRAACCRCRRLTSLERLVAFDSGSKLHALHTLRDLGRATEYGVPALAGGVLPLEAGRKLSASRTHRRPTG